MSGRKSIPKSVRFEVFKRDKFTCQYCGRSAPEVALHVDHIQPVSKDGNNDITNLITACSECNLGKGARELSDDAVIQKRKAQLDELQERREQIEMMSEWQSELMAIENIELNNVIDILDSMTPGWYYNEKGKSEIRSLIRRFSSIEVINAGKLARDQYIVIGESGEATEESAVKFTNLLPKICEKQTMFNHNPYLGEFAYISGILKNRFGVRLSNQEIHMLCDVTERGVNVQDLIEHAKYVKNYLIWKRNLREMLSEADNGE